MLRHYEHVSLKLWERTHDWELALAGYLHGITDMNLVGQVLTPEQKGIATILEGRRRMMSLDPGDPEVPERLLNGFLPHLRDLRSLILLVIEALHHADAEDVMGRFSRSFDNDPLDLPGAIPTIPRHDSGITDARFLKAVIAPVCEHLGLWRERNLAEDIALFQTDRGQMGEWLTFVREEQVLREKERRVSLIRSALKNVAIAEVTWRWHHISSFGRRLGTGSTFGNWRHKVSLWSVLAVRCESPVQCYEVLGKLSLAEEFEKHQRDFSDYLAQPKPTGYQALRTTVLHGTGDATALLTVEILPRSTEEQRLRTLTRTGWQRSPQEKLDVQENVQVFSPDGRMYSLPAGSKVLNFASAIHGSLVAWARGAYVNRVLVDLLHPLQSGDIIQIDVGPLLRKELPKGWEDNVPTATRRRIRQGHREALRKCLLDLGREQLRCELHKAGIDYAEELNEFALDSYVEECANLIKPNRGGPNTADWWLNEFGMLNDKIQPSTWKVDRGHTDQFIKNLVSLLNRSPRLERNTISVPKDQHQAFDDITTCDKCRPGPGRKVVGCNDDRTLVLHRATSECGQGGFDVEWHHILYREQTFIVETSNRVGIAADVLACVARRNVDVIDHAGANLGRTWAVIRFRVQGVGPGLVQELVAAIKLVPGVIRVFRPGDEIPVILANALPRLDPIRSLLTARSESPYLANSQDILDDTYFYGRRRELQELSRALDLCRKASHQGLIVSVTGPLKFGKTSLLNRFIRDTRVQDPACAIARAQCPLGRGWEETESALRTNLLEEVEAHADRRGVSVPEDATGSIQNLCLFFRQKLGSTVFLFIDEAMRLFFATTDKSGKRAEKRALIDLLAWVTNTQGVFLAMAGPKYSERYLEMEYRLILDKTTRIDLKPFDSQDTLSLLRAENLGTNDLGIQATLSHAILVTRATGGNPFWTNLIAGIAWDAARQKHPFVLQGRALREAVIKSMDERAGAFEDRIFDPIWDQQTTTLTRMVLLILAGGVDVANGNRAKAGPVSYSGILELCKQNGLNPRIKALDTVLAELQDRGTIQQPKQPKQERAYEFTANLLREFLTRRLDYAEALWQEGNQ